MKFTFRGWGEWSLDFVVAEYNDLDYGRVYTEVQRHLRELDHNINWDENDIATAAEAINGRRSRY